MSAIDSTRSLIDEFGSDLPLIPENKKPVKKAPILNVDSIEKPENNVFLLNIEKTRVTSVTGVTINNDAACSGNTSNNTGVTGVTADDNFIPYEDENLEHVSFNDLVTPCYIVQDDWFILSGTKHKAGVWYCYEKPETKSNPSEQVAIYICSPLHIDAITNTENGRFFGRLLRFKDTLGRWRTWAMPMETLRGNCEILRGDLLATGVDISMGARDHLPKYLQWQVPDDVVLAATKTGWTVKGNTFVFHDCAIGPEKVHFQNETMIVDGIARAGGSYRKWRDMAGLCDGNPVLMVSLCVALAGPLLAKVHRDSGGVHWIGDSSIGKTTALCVGASVWGGDDFKRTWRATSNGLEGVAAMLSDTCLCLDEISEADPREVGAIVYSLGNGTGKTRADRTGSARSAHRWRVSILSTGERSITAAMHEGGKQSKAGQLVRLLNIPAKRKYGVFDDLHSFTDGRELADHFKTECGRHYGYAGIKFVEYLVSLGNADFGATLAKIETQFHCKDPQAGRAASRFAVYAMAGELGIEAGILPWTSGSALESCKLMFTEWQSTHGVSHTEHKQILQNVADYILKHGDNKFTDKNNPDDKPKLDRAGWYTDLPDGRVYLFSSAALREAGGNYDFTRVLDAIDSSGWLVDKDPEKRRKVTSITGSGKHGLYWVKPSEADNA